MSERLPVCSAKDVIRVLRRHGFRQVSQKGSHQKWRHPNGRQVIVAMHGNKPIPAGTFKSIIEGRFSMTDLTSGETSSKSARPANDFKSWETVSIAESAQCPLVRCPAQLLVA